VSRFTSVFSQFLQLFSRVDFQRAAKDTHAERHARGFTCRGQFVAMLFCQLGRAHSLRETCLPWAQAGLWRSGRLRGQAQPPGDHGPQADHPGLRE
jgi:hypothetical protein